MLPVIRATSFALSGLKPVAVYSRGLSYKMFQIISLILVAVSAQFNPALIRMSVYLALHYSLQRCLLTKPTEVTSGK